MSIGLEDGSLAAAAAAVITFIFRHERREWRRRRVGDPTERIADELAAIRAEQSKGGRASRRLIRELLTETRATRAVLDQGIDRQRVQSDALGRIERDLLAGRHRPQT